MKNTERKKCAACAHNLCIVPEVYYLHEVCHSCTNLVHCIVPEVYYLHKVCHSCTNLVPRRSTPRTMDLAHS